MNKDYSTETSSISTSPEKKNPSNSINPTVGMKKPAVMPGGKKKKRYRASKAFDTSTLLKDMVAEGDFVIASCEDDLYVGIVQYVMTEGMFGIASSDYAIEASAENPAVLVRILELEEDEGIWEESEYLVGAESKMVTKIEPLSLEVETIANADSSEVAMAMYDSSIGKADPCWEGYTQRGMKEQNGVMVPNCIPVEKTESIFAGIGKDYTKSTTTVYRVEE